MRAPEEYFAFGAQAMQAKIVGWLAMKGHMDIAPQVLELKSPQFSEPEVMTVSSKKENTK